MDGECDVVETRDFYPFGLRMPGRTSQESPTDTEEDFTGHVKDNSTGLHYAGARSYSAAFGRWSSIDPLADKFTAYSPYNYVMRNPVRLSDSNGMDPCPDNVEFCAELPELIVEAESTRPNSFSGVWSQPGMYVNLGRFTGIGFTGISQHLERVVRPPSALGSVKTAISRTGYGVTAAMAAYDIYRNPTRQNIWVTTLSTAAGVGLTTAFCTGTAFVVCGTGIIIGATVSYYSDREGGKIYRYLTE